MSAKIWTVRDADGDVTTVEIGRHVVTSAEIEEMHHTPASARELAAALIEAADLVEGVKREAEPMTDAPPVPDCVIESIERLCDVLTSMTLDTGLVAHVNRARAAIAKASR